MNEPLKALYTLCEELDSQADAFGNSEYKKGLRNASNQLKAQLRAWDERLGQANALSTVDRLGNPAGVFISESFVRDRLLGAPPK